MAQNKSGRTEKSKTQKEIDKLESDAAEIKIEELTVQFLSQRRQILTYLFLSCIDSLHVRKVDQRSYHGFYCFTSHFYHFLGIFLVLGEFLVHAVVMFFVDAVV